MTADQSFELVAPAGVELVSGKAEAAGAVLRVGPRATVVVYTDQP